MNPNSNPQVHNGKVALPTVLLFLLLTFGYGFLWFSYSRDSMNPWLLVGLATLFSYGMFTVMHEASHGNIACGAKKFQRFEIVLGWLSGLFLVFPFSTFTAIHLRHHAHTNDPDQDPDHYVNGKNFLDILFRCFTVIFYYYVHALRKESKFDASIKHTRVHTIVFIFLVIGLIFSLSWFGYGFHLLYIFILPALLAAPFLGFTFDWLPHFPHHNMNKYRNTRIVTVPGLEYVLLYQSYHLIHHLYPRVPFYKYKTKFQLIEPELTEKKSPIEGFRALDYKLFDAQSSYQDIAEGSTWEYALNIESIQELTHDSVAVKFKNIGGLPFKFEAGQYVVISKMVNHEKISRCYSISSDPKGGELKIGIKRVPGGLLSNAFIDAAEVDVPVHVSGPFGNFKLNKNKQNHLFIAGGSGITPILSMIYSSLNSPNSQNKLIYGCRSSADVMFKAELEELVRDYPDQFELEITYDRMVLEKQVQLIGSMNSDSAVYLCGPSMMMQASKQALKQLDFPMENIRTEEFKTGEQKLSGEQFQIEKNGYSFKAYESETILEASKRNLSPLPHACGMGQCGTCRVQLISGEVHWKTIKQDVLLESEIENGYILTCLCQPKSEIKLGDKY